MTPLRHIRKNLFGMTQAEFAAHLGISQGYVSKAEREPVVPGGLQLPLRDMAKESGIEWSDSLFFEVPEVAA